MFVSSRVFLSPFYVKSIRTNIFTVGWKVNKFLIWIDTYESQVRLIVGIIQVSEEVGQ